MKKNRHGFLNKAAHFVKHYLALLLLAACCAVITVLLIGMCA